MTEYYFIKKYYNMFKEDLDIDYNDNKLINILINYDTDKHNHSLDNKMLVLLTQKMARTLVKYFDENIDYLLEQNPNSTDIIEKSITYTRKIQKILFTEDQIYQKIIQICDKYDKNIPWFITTDYLNNDEHKYAVKSKFCK